MEPASEYLAGRIRELREDRGWAAQRLADQCAELGQHSLTRGAIAKIEAGIRQSVTFGEAVTLAEVFGVGLADLAPPTPRRNGMCRACGVVPRDTGLHAGWHKNNDRGETS